MTRNTASASSRTAAPAGRRGAAAARGRARRGPEPAAQLQVRPLRLVPRARCSPARSVIRHGRPLGITAEEEQARVRTAVPGAAARRTLTVEARLIASVAEVEIKTLPCRIARLVLLAPDVMQVWLRLPAVERLPFQRRAVPGCAAGGRAAAQLLDRQPAARQRAARAARAPRGRRRLHRAAVRRRGRRRSRSRRRRCCASKDRSASSATATGAVRCS